MLLPAPFAIRLAASEIYDLHPRSVRLAPRRGLVACGMRSHAAPRRDRSRLRPARRRAMRTVMASGRMAVGCGSDDHRIAGRQAGEQAGIAVPGRRGRAADAPGRRRADTTVKCFSMRNRVLLALRLFPDHLFRDARHFLPPRRPRLPAAAVLRMRSAGLEGHQDSPRPVVCCTA